MFNIIEIYWNRKDMLGKQQSLHDFVRFRAVDAPVKKDAGQGLGYSSLVGRKSSATAGVCVVFSSHTHSKWLVRKPGSSGSSVCTGQPTS